MAKAKYILAGTTAQRPTVTTVGFEYFNTSNNVLEIWNGTSWQASVPTATTSVKGIMNQAISVPNGSSTDTLLNALRTAGIIAS